MNRLNLLCYSNFFNSSCFTINLENFVSFSWFINLFFNLQSHFERILPILQFTRLLDSIGLAGLMLYAIPSLLDIYTIDAHSIHFQFCSHIAFPSLLGQCYILMQYLFVIYPSNLVLFLVYFNVYATTSFSQLCSLSLFCFFYMYIRFILFNSSLTT